MCRCYAVGCCSHGRGLHAPPLQCPPPSPIVDTTLAAAAVVRPRYAAAYQYRCCCNCYGCCCTPSPLLQTLVAVLPRFGAAAAAAVVVRPRHAACTVTPRAADAAAVCLPGPTTSVMALVKPMCCLFSRPVPSSCRHKLHPPADGGRRESAQGNKNGRGKGGRACFVELVCSPCLSCLATYDYPYRPRLVTCDYRYPTRASP